ncbi:MAG: class 3 adenylate cyclase [Gammaproteobacteria bacterium]|jgi:class 3 adenylate cyclase
MNLGVITMTENRTWLASVLFLDIVGYTKEAVDQQMSIKQNFTAIVVPALQMLNRDECLQLDTGDGCAICYLGDPEKLYSIALTLQRTFSAIDVNSAAAYQVRLGLNLGPIKITNGISGDRNCVGAGINDAQRVMDFARENQLLISKSFYEMVCSMSSSYSEQLDEAGTRLDKHEKVHVVYELSSSYLSRVPGSVNSMSGGFEIEPNTRERIEKEFSRYIGREKSEQLISNTLINADSLAHLCELLTDSLSEDDRYHFNEFLNYYGYSK